MAVNIYWRQPTILLYGTETHLRIKTAQKRTWRAQTNRNKGPGDTETTSGKCHQYKPKERATPWCMCVGDWCSPFTWCFYLCKTPCKIPLFFFFLSFPVLWCHTRWRSGDGKLSNCVFLCHSWKGTFPFHSFHWFISTCFLVLQYSSNFLTTNCTSHFTKTYQIFFFSSLPLIDKVLSYIYIYIYITKKNKKCIETKANYWYIIWKIYTFFNWREIISIQVFSTINIFLKQIIIKRLNIF